MQQTSYVNSYFVNKQFNGDLKQSITITTRGYKHDAVLYEMGNTEMATDFPACLSDPARAFFLANVKPGMKFEGIEEFIVS